MRFSKPLATAVVFVGIIFITRLSLLTKSSTATTESLINSFNAMNYVGVPGPEPVAPLPDFYPPNEPITKPSEERSAINWLGFRQQPSDVLGLKTSFNGVDGTEDDYAADCAMAAGASSIIIATNHTVAILDKTGRTLASTIMITLFGQARQPGESAGDPRIIFDSGSNRFFIVATGTRLNPNCTPGNCVGHIFLAVSKNSNPTTFGSSDWYFYSFDGTLEGSTPTTLWSDFPGIGVNNSVLVVSTIANDQMGFTQYARIRVFDKSKLLAGEPATWNDFFRMKDPVNEASAVNFQPAVHKTNADTFFVASPSMSNSCGLIIWGIKTSPSTPTLSAVTVVADGQCDNIQEAPQQRSAANLDIGNKWQLSATTYQSGSIWTARTAAKNYGSKNVSAIRWYQVDVASWPASVRFAQNSILGTGNAWYFYPSIAVDSSNNVALLYGRSSSTEFPSTYFAGRLSNDPPNTLRQGKLLKTSTTSLQFGVQRTVHYGDYFTSVIDPDTGSVWLHGEYARLSNSWGTWVGNADFCSNCTGNSITNVSSANYKAPIASESIVAVFGTGLAPSIQSSSSVPLPTGLAGTAVKVKDSSGIERNASLFFVSPEQINYLVPPGTAPGTATVNVIGGGGVFSTGTVQVVPVAPGLFSANASGQGVAAAVVLRIKADGAQIYEAGAQFDAAQNKFVSRPIDLGPETDRVFLLLFGTGIRFISSLQTATAKIGGTDAQVLFAGAQGGFVGLDQVNLTLPRSLIGRGEMDIAFTADNRTANIVRINIK